MHLLKKNKSSQKSNTEFKHRREKNAICKHMLVSEYLVSFQSNLIIHETATDNWLWIAVMTVRPVQCRQNA